MGKEKHVGNFGGLGEGGGSRISGKFFVKLGRAETFVNFGCRWTMMDYCIIGCKGVKNISWLT